MMPQKRTRRRSERRNRPRADARLSMRVEEAREGQAAHFVTESQNISASGVYCTSTHYMAPLSKVALTIVLPRLPGGRAAKELVKCEGIVVRCEQQSKKTDRRYELACMFSGLDEKRRATLDEYVAWRNLQALRAATDGTRPVKRARVQRPRARTAASTTRRKTATRRRVAR
jgi:hypothetical protein